MKYTFVVGLSLFLFFTIIPPLFLVRGQSGEGDSNAPSAPDVYYKATVVKILDQGVVTGYGMTLPYQKVLLTILDGDMSRKQITIDYGKGYSIDKSQLVKAGDTVLVSKTTGLDNTPTYLITDQYRLDKIIPIIIIFFIAILLLSGWKGAGSILGMIVSLGVIVGYIVPQIIAGKDALFVSVVGCLIIMMTTIYLAHGFSKRTTIALISTFLTLIVTAVLSGVFVQMTHLTGLGNEDAYALKLGPTGNINFKGLLLGGILIGVLGVLDDVTTGLSASVFELAKANPKYTFGQLCKSGLVIGREHIASLVNTLVLAYAGVSLPLFLIIVLNPSHTPMNVILNDGLIVEEVVRTLAGSMGLVLAVPLTTIFASYYITKLSKHS